MFAKFWALITLLVLGIGAWMFFRQLGLGCWRRSSAGWPPRSVRISWRILLGVALKPSASA